MIYGVYLFYTDRGFDIDLHDDDDPIRVESSACIIPFGIIEKGKLDKFKDELEELYKKYVDIS